MNDLPPDPIPPDSTPPLLPPATPVTPPSLPEETPAGATAPLPSEGSRAVSRGSLAAGFAVGLLAWGCSGVPSAGILFLMFDCVVLPILAVVLACIRGTRRFGLGLLLATAIGWLILGAMCGGLLPFPFRLG